MKLNDAQEALLAKIREASEKHKVAKLVEYERARREADERILATLVERDKLVSLGAAAGIPLAQIGKRGMGTSNHGQVREALAHGARFLEASVGEPEQVGPYTWDPSDSRLTVYLSQGDFEPYLAMLARHPKPEGEAWDFYLVDGRLLPNFSQDDETWQHPVVTVVMTEQGKREALGYIESRTKVAA